MNSEPGADIVRAALGKAIISAVNYSEVLKKTIERCQTIGPVVAFLHGFSVEIVPFDESLATTGAELYPQTKPHEMSFADRACLALGVRRGFAVLTAERKCASSPFPSK